MTPVILTTADGRQVTLTRAGDRLLVYPRTALSPDELQTLGEHRDVLLALVDLPDQVRARAWDQALAGTGAPLTQHLTRPTNSNQTMTPNQLPNPTLAQAPEAEPRRTEHLQLRLDSSEEYVMDLAKYRSPYIRSEELQRSGPQVRVIYGAVEETLVDPKTGTRDTKAVLLVDDRKLTLNKVNMDWLFSQFGSTDSDAMSGHHVEIYFDPEVRFGTTACGGIRLRLPQQELAL